MSFWREDGLGSRRVLLGVVLGVYTVMALPFLAEAPLGRDAWRETMVLSVGRSFCEEGGPPWHPRVDGREGTSGITGMELPLLPYVHSVARCAGLPQVPIARVLTLLFALLGIVSMRLLTLRLFDDELTATLAWGLFTFSPLIVFYGRSIQPDVPGIALGLLGSLLFFRALDPLPRIGPLLLSAAVMSAAMLIKAHTVAFGLGLVWVVIAEHGWRKLFTPPMLMFAAASLGPAVGWYSYAKHLQAVSGLGSFELGQEVNQGLSYWMGWEKWLSAFIEKPFDIYLLPAATAFAFLTLALSPRRIPAWVGGSLVGVIFYFVFMLKHVAHHYYSGMISVAPLCCIAAVGLVKWLGPDSRVRAPSRILVAAALAGAAIHGGFRTKGWHAKTVYEAPLANARETLDAQAPKDERVTLLSKSSPTYFWFLDRKGWRIDWPTPQDLAPNQLPTRFAVIDRRRVKGEERTAVEQQLADHGWTRRFENEAVDLWERTSVPTPASPNQE